MELSTSLMKRHVLSDSLERPNWALDSGRNPSALWLDKNECLDPELHKILKETLLSIDLKSIYTYPNLYPVYKKLSDYSKVPIEQLLLTPGSDGVIRYVFELFVNEGDLVIHTSPTFAMYPVYCKMFGAKSYELSYSSSEAGPHLALEEILKVIKELKPKLFCLPNPDSPTGSLLSLEEVREILAVAHAAHSIVLIDEAYFEFTDQTAVPLLSEFDNLVIARTFAKGWGLAGLRIGYAISSKTITKHLHKMRPMYEVNTFGIAFLEKMLDRVDDVFHSVHRLKLGQNYFKEQMRLLGFKVLDNFGNFQHVAFAEKAEEIHKALDGKVLYRKKFNEQCLKDYSRFSITTKDLFDPIITDIKNIIKK